MTKLIAAGSSDTEQGEQQRKHHPALKNWPASQRYNKRGITTWPQIVAEKMGWDFVNIAVGGCDNAFIENSIYDEVQSTPNNEDIVVMSLWTCPIRLSTWGIWFFSTIDITGNADPSYWPRHHRMHREDWQELPVSYFNEPKDIPPNNRWPFRKYLISQMLSQLDFDYKEIMKHSARSINRTMNWLDDIGIKNYHETGLGWVLPVREEYIEYGKTLNMNLDHWESGFLHELKESELLPCMHPNQAGQSVIAKMFIDKMEGTYVPLNSHSTNADRFRLIR